MIAVNVPGRSVNETSASSVKRCWRLRDDNESVVADDDTMRLTRFMASVVGGTLSNS